MCIYPKCLFAAKQRMHVQSRKLYLAVVVFFLADVDHCEVSVMKPHCYVSANKSERRPVETTLLMSWLNA